MKKLFLLVALSSGMSLTVMSDAHAYLDPGTGSMLLQGLIAGLAAASVAIGRYWYKVKSFFSRSSDRTTRRPPPEAGDR